MYWDQREAQQQHCIRMHQMGKYMEITLLVKCRSMWKKLYMTLALQKHCGRMFQSETLESVTGYSCHSRTAQYTQALAACASPVLD